MERSDYKKIVVIGTSMIGGIIGFFLAEITGLVFGFLLPLLFFMIVWSYKKGSSND